MTKSEKVNTRSRTADRIIAVALGSMLFLPAGYVLSANAADANSTVAASATTDESIRPFEFHVPQAQLDDLRRRIAETRWPDKETVNDDSQGIQLARVQELVRYWGPTTIGGKPKRNSMLCRSLLQTSTASTFSSSTSNRATRMPCRSY